MPSGSFNTGGKGYLVNLWANRDTIKATHYGALITNTGGGIPDNNQNATAMSTFTETAVSGYARSATTVASQGSVLVDNALNTATYTYSDTAFVYSPTADMNGLTYMIVTDTASGGGSVPRTYYDFSSGGTVPVNVPSGATLTLKNAKFRIKNAT